MHKTSTERKRQVLQWLYSHTNDTPDHPEGKMTNLWGSYFFTDGEFAEMPRELKHAMAKKHEENEDVDYVLVDARSFSEAERRFVLHAISKCGYTASKVEVEVIWE